jgi:hypothetical protein
MVTAFSCFDWALGGPSLEGRRRLPLWGRVTGPPLQERMRLELLANQTRLHADEVFSLHTLIAASLLRRAADA